MLALMCCFIPFRLITLTAGKNNVTEVTASQGQVIYFTLILIRDDRHASTYSSRNSLQPLHLVQAAHHAAEGGEKDKDDHHESHVTAAGGVFHSSVCESLSLGSLHSHHVIKAIARRLSCKVNMTVSEVGLS